MNFILQNYVFACVCYTSNLIKFFHQDMLTYEFGDETINETFDLFKRRLRASLVYVDPSNDRTIVVVAILKRNNV